MLLTLLKIEWLKVRKYRAFWIIFIFLILLFPSVTMAFGRIFSTFTKSQDGLKELIGNPFNFNTVFYISAYLNNGLNIAWGMLLILMVGGEFQNKTMRQNVIDGQERSHIVTSKLILVIIFSLLSTALLMVSALIAGFIFADNSFYFHKDLLEVFGTFFFAAFMQMMFALVFGFLIKRPALSVILYLGYTVFIENILVMILVGIFKTNYARLLLTQSADELTTVPLVKRALFNPYVPFESLPVEAPWIASVIYAAVIIFLLYRYIDRTVLK